jgi:hypothetical protein
MHGPGTVAAVFALRAEGLGARRIASRTGLPVATVRDWLAGRVPRHSRPGESTLGSATCQRCGHAAHAFASLPPAYGYLLGLYLGDGCISEHRGKVFRLRIFLDLKHSLIIAECAAAMQAVMPSNKVHQIGWRSSFVERSEPSSVAVSSFSKSWPCLLPQHGPGVKHKRVIRLTAWQEELVHQDPKQLLRGLIQSDGCRFTNTGRNWTCPRYSFSNKSDDIRQIFCDTCEQLGLRSTRANDTIYVSRKADVELLDTFIGPKR